MKRLVLVSFMYLVTLSSLTLATEIEAFYIVPTAGGPVVNRAAVFATVSDLSEYGSPEVSGVLKFRLPAELTGVDQSFQMQRRDDGSWTGPGVAGQCGVQDKIWFVCQVAFDRVGNTLKFDTIRRDEILRRQVQSNVDLSRRLEVVRSFEGQPIGLIKIRLSAPE